LKANYWAGADGSRQFINWHDSTLNDDCDFAPAIDATTRCLPGGVTSVGDGSNSGYQVFADSICAQPLAFAPCTQAHSTKYAQKTVKTGTGCQTAYLRDVYSIGAAFTGTVYTNTHATLLADGGIGYSCATATASEIAGWLYYSVVAEVSASSFVQATLQTEP
jgi:hypothetical protein